MRSRLVLLIAIATRVLGSAGPAAQPSQSPQSSLDPALVEAWARAGGALRPGDIPELNFERAPQPGEFAVLPAPTSVFGVHFNAAVLTAQHLRALGKLSHLRAFSCYHCSLAEGANLASLAAAPDLQDLDFNGFTVSDAALSQLAGAKQLRTLRLRGVSAGEAGLSWISGLEKLEVLRLQYTRVTSGTLGSFARLPRLRELYFQENDNKFEVSTAFLDELPKLTHLEKVSFVGSNLTDDAMPMLAQVKTLRILEIYGGKIIGRNIAALAALPDLGRLDLTGNPLAAEAIEGIAKLPKLEALLLATPVADDSWLRAVSRLTDLRLLSLSSASITDDGLRELVRLTKLEELRLSGTKITGAGLRWLAPLSNLRVLRLGSSGVTDSGLSSLAALPQLQTVGVANTAITDSAIESLGTLKELRSLVLGGNITDAGVLALRSLQQLTELDFDLEGSGITDTGIRGLAALPQLRSLWLPLESPRITIAGIAELTNALPNLIVDNLSGPAIRARFEAAAALTIADPAARLAALEAVRPSAPPSSGVDKAILATLIANWPDRTGAIGVAFERVVALIPEGAQPSVRIASLVTVAGRLVDKRLMLDRLEALIDAALKAVTDSAQRSGGLAMLGRIHLAHGDAARARMELDESLALVPNAADRNSAPVFAALAELEAIEGLEREALDHFVTAGALRNLSASQLAAARSLHRKVHGTDAGLEPAIAARYRRLFPSPVSPTRYVPSKERAGRVVLFELLTATGCGPCAAADLAMEAIVARYPQDALVAVAYHRSVPSPDPMVVTGAARRAAYYGQEGTPTEAIDGRLGGIDGGKREEAPAHYAAYVSAIEKRLAVPPAAALSVSAALSGDRVSVTATVTSLPVVRDALRLHILLVERELGYTGESGIRQHPMVVRAVAGGLQPGLPIRTTGARTYDFSLRAIRADIASTLAGEIAARRSPNTHMAEGQATTDIDPSRLVVVAFVQQGVSGNGSAPTVLQAAQSDVVAATTPVKVQPRKAESVTVTPSRPAPVPAAPIKKLPVQWSIQMDSSTAAPNRMVPVTLTAKIDPGWHLYSMAQAPGGPSALRIEISKSPVFSAFGVTTEPAPTVRLDPAFALKTTFFEESARFELPVRVATSATSGRHTLVVSVTFQVCSDKLCLAPQTVELRVDVQLAPRQ